MKWLLCYLGSFVERIDPSMANPKILTLVTRGGGQLTPLAFRHFQSDNPNFAHDYAQSGFDEGFWTKKWKFNMYSRHGGHFGFKVSIFEKLAKIMPTTLKMIIELWIIAHFEA